MVQLKKKRSSTGSWVAGVLVIAALAAGAWLWWKATPGARQGTAIVSSTPAIASSARPATASSAIHYPIAQAPAAASSAPLPALDASDTAVVDGLLALAGTPGLDGLLRRDQVIRRIVATVDALPRQGVNPEILPLHGPKGSFLVEQADGKLALSPRNAARYAPYMQVLEHVEPQALVAWYVQHYPLFQQAYRELGYPQGYFNDRLVQAIDDMLAAPVPDAPVALVQPKVFYRYVDPDLEARSAGQKLLMRLGADDEARVKAKRRSIRALLVAQHAPAAAASRANGAQQ